MFHWLRTWIASIRARRAAQRLARAELEIRRVKARACARRRREREAQALIERARAATRRSFVIADLETTGFSASDEIINLAAIRVDESGCVIDELSVFVRIRARVPQHIVELTGITDQLLARQGINLAAALDEFFAFCADDPVFFHNASFDTRMLEAACARVSMLFTNEVHCSLKLARAVWPRLPSHKLEVLARHVGAPAPTHLGLDDVHSLRFVLQAALKKEPLSAAA